MAELRQFKLPDVGEGLTEADIVRWHVQPGDTVKVNQIIVEIETAKAVVELPSPHAGVVSSLLVTEGETVDVGTPIIAIDTGSTDTGGAGTGSANTGSAGPAPVDVPPLQTPTSADLIPPPPAEAAEPAAAGAEQALAHLLELGIGRIGIVQDAGHLRIDSRLRPRAVDDDGNAEPDRVGGAALAFGGHHQFRLDPERQQLGAEIDGAGAGHLHQRADQIEIGGGGLALVDLERGR